MDVSIIIVNYNMLELCVNCIKSVYIKTKDLNYEIILIDNNSLNNEAGEIEKLFPEIKIIKNNENVGFGRANNQGIEQACGKYIFCLNPDTLLVNNSIKILYDFMENNPYCGACGGNLFDRDMNYSLSFGYGDSIISLLLRKTLLKYFFFKEFVKLKKYIKNTDRTKIHEVRHLTGADLMLRKTVLDKVGLFNERFFMYFEENELETRIRRAGYKIFFVPSSKIIHLEDKYRNNKHKSNFFKESCIEYYRVCYGEAWGEIAEFLINKKLFM